jgi:2',3'-cyclic-nucleotide 2'-phosphodiesterase/3'-nucleotidase
MARWFWILFIALSIQAQELRIQILGTTDMHGHVLAQDAFSLQPIPQGWAKIATLIRRQRALNPNTLLVDSGDTLQGEPINYVRTMLRPELPEPSIAIMNALGYAAMAVGNHDFDFGLPNLRAAEKQARFPLLSANTLDRTGKPAFLPYRVVVVAGVRVALLGLTTPQVPTMTEPGNIEGLSFEDLVVTARRLVPQLRKQEKADVVIALVHSGLGSLEALDRAEDGALRLAEAVPGLDAIFAGHSHQAVQREHKGIPIVQAQNYGRALAQVELVLQKEQGRWRVASGAGHLLRPDEATVADPEVLQLTEALRKATDRYLDTPATELAVDLDSRWSRMEDSPLMQLIHQVQRQAAGAQLSAAAAPGTRLFIPKGPTSVRQFYALAPFESRVARIRITGDQLKRYLEHGARHYAYSWEPDLYNPTVPFYQYDMVDGVSYALDLGKPVGSRVVNLRYQGHPVKEEQSFTLALSTYRLYGGGGYMEAIGFQGKAEWVSEASQRNLLLAFVLAKPTLNLTASQTWRTVPYLDRQRVLDLAR